MKTNVADYQETIHSQIEYANRNNCTADIAKVLKIDGYKYTCQMLIKNVSVVCDKVLDLSVNTGDYVIVLFMDNDSRLLLSYIRSGNSSSTLYESKNQHDLTNGIIIAKIKEA